MSFFRLRRILLLFLILFISVNAFSVHSTAKENLENGRMNFDCESAILMDAASGNVLYEFNADKPLPPASVTKIMTLLLIMEEIEKGNLKYSDSITTSAYAASMGGSQIYLKEGEQMSAEDMIKSVVISSANDAAVALAEHICGSEDIFVARMNERARELGMKNTNFENTNGLDDTTKNHLTSARDIALMSRELLKYEEILKYSSTWMDTIRNGTFGLTNTNRLVRFYQGATGLKTGSTAKAKFCVSATAKRENMHLICVVMGAPSSDVRNSIATSLLNWGFSNFELYNDPSTDLNSIRVTGGNESYAQIRSLNFDKIIEKGAGKKINKIISLPDRIPAPVKKGETVGYTEYYLDGTLLGKAEILSTVNIDKINFSSLFVRFLSKFLIK